MNNLVQTANDMVTIQMSDPGFHFGFADNVIIENVEIASDMWVQQATVTLENGQAIVQVSACEALGNYSGLISFESESILYSKYDHDGNPATASISTDEISFTVVAGPPAGIRLNIIERSNDALGDPNVLETDEVVTLSLGIVDAFGNQVTTFKDSNGDRRDANFVVDVVASGNAVFNNLSNTARLSVVRGKSEFNVTDSIPEVVQISVADVTPIIDGFIVDAQLDLEFFKNRPAIFGASFETVHNSINPSIIFTYTEPIINGGSSAPVTLTLDGTLVEGEFLVNANTVTFTPNDNVELNKSYQFDTSVSTWVGVAENDAVLVQQGSVLSPQIAIPSQPSSYALEGSEQILDILFGADVDFSGIFDGNIVINGVESSFDYTARTFIMPATPVDGVDVDLSLSGMYQGEQIRSANTISIKSLLKDGDYDGDLISNSLEIEMGLDPTNTDSDEDGTPDIEEDTDGDGYSNGYELGQGTDPNNNDTTLPEVVSITPEYGFASASLRPEITIVFSEPLRPATITSNTFTLSYQGATVVGNITIDANNQTVVWRTTDVLEPGGIYNIALTNDIRDGAGNRLDTYMSEFSVSDFAVEITDPDPLTPITEGETITIRAIGANLDHINRVKFYNDQVEIGSDADVPFEITYVITGTEQLTISARAEIGGTNNALTASVAGSSSASFEHAFTPLRAIDGSTDSNINNGSVAVVKGEPQAWFEADLGRIQRIEDISVYLMEGCCVDSNWFIVLVASEPFDPSDFDSVGIPDSFVNNAVEIYHTTDDPDEVRVDISSGSYTGRYIRVVNLADDFLALAEVEIMEETISVDSTEVVVDVISSGN